LPFAFALFKPVAIAIPSQDMDMMGEPVEQGTGEAFGAEDFGPSGEGQVAGHERRGALVSVG
jgi:hypothetical protein